MILVKPLQPPFNVDIMKFHFHDVETVLAVSQTDGLRIRALFDDNEVKGRSVMLVPQDDGVHIGVCVLQ